MGGAAMSRRIWVGVDAGKAFHWAVVLGVEGEVLPEEAWATIAAGEEGPCEGRPWEWACLELSVDPGKGMQRWLLIRRTSEDPEDDLAFYQAYGPEGTPTGELVKVCQRGAGRWKIASPRLRESWAWTTTR
jgi:hypothetical protein